MLSSSNCEGEKNKILLPEDQVPNAWYNIQADFPVPMPDALHPGTLQPMVPADLAPLFPSKIIEQEFSKERWIPIPDEVRDAYKKWRPTPVYRAKGLEKAVGTDCRIFYKYEGGNPAGSHKVNTAIAQAYYNSLDGVQKITTETGAGQWGTALSYACSVYNIGLEVFMVRGSFQQKPYRKALMNVYGANVYPSPSQRTAAGRKVLEEHPDTSGSLGIAISEAVEACVTSCQAGNKAKYALGSVLNHVLLHQTVIGLEAEAQLNSIGVTPDLVIGCFGGGSNFAGISFPFARHVMKGEKQIRIIAAEPDCCPKLSQGQLSYDFGDLSGMTPLLPMYTLGHDYIPPSSHAGGLRYHGAAPLCSHLKRLGFMESQSFTQQEIFKAGVLFSRTEGIVPAPESAHAIACAIGEAKSATEPKDILFCLSGHGNLDLKGYEDYLAGTLADSSFSAQESCGALSKLDAFPKLPPL